MAETQPALGSGEMLKGCAELMKSIGPLIETLGPLIPVLLQAFKCFAAMSAENKERVAAFLASQVPAEKQAEIKAIILSIEV